MPDITRRDARLHAPPCWPDGQPCPNACARAQYDRLVHNRHELHGPWIGWRFAGRELVSPDGDRINAERLRGILFAEALRRRYPKLRPSVAPGVNRIVLPPRESFDGCA